MLKQRPNPYRFNSPLASAEDRSNFFYHQSPKFFAVEFMNSNQWCLDSSGSYPLPTLDTITFWWNRVSSLYGHSHVSPRSRELCVLIFSEVSHFLIYKPDPF